MDKSHEHPPKTALAITQNAVTTSEPTAAPSVLPAAVRTRILFYSGVLLLLLGFGAPGGGLIGVPISFLLKNKLELKAHESSWDARPVREAWKARS
jgi:hypothetical protein